MWKFGFAVLFLSWSVSGQEQFLREVTNPTGPSQVILRGGSLNSIGTGEEGQIQPFSDQGAGQEVEERYVVTDEPQPFQETPIPEDGGENNPFTNGEAGFGLRLSQQAPQSNPVRQQVQRVNAPRPPPTPQAIQQHHSQIFQEQQAPVEIDQPAPIIHQTEISLPQLPPGQQYVDVYGRPIVLEGQQPPQPQAPQPQVAPTPTSPPTAAPQTAPPPPPPQHPQQIFVDQYGRQLTQQHLITQQVLQPAGVPVAHHHILQPAPVQQVVQPVVEKKLISHSPGLTLQTYAVPAVRKFGNLIIPYAQKVQFAKSPDQEIVFPPTVPAPAIVKSRHRTRFSPVKVLTPAVHHVAPAVHEIHHVPQEIHHVAQEVHHVAPTIHQVHALPAGVPVVNYSHAVPQLEIHHQPPPGQVLLQHPQQLVHLQQSPQVLHHHQPQQLVHLEQPPQILHQPQPQQLVHLQQPPQLLHHPQQLVHLEQQPAQLFHQPQHLVQVGQPLPGPVVEHHIHHQPQAVHHIAPAVHVEKHIVPAAPAPVVLKKVKPVVPAVTLIQQPILSKVLFQRHIFNVKHGSEPIIYQDLCTVYPYQKNLRACVLKKAALPELHHPDVRTVNVEYQQQTDQSIISPGSPIVGPAPPTSSPSVTVSKALPQNIQDAIQRESAKLKEAATKNTESNAVEAPSSSAQPDTAESRNSSSSGKSRRKKNKGSTSRQTTTTEKPFKLA